ncbi:MAG: OmpH family outer membrane protein [Rickettsiales bacterium]|jgi:outer membrane protein|nr:OmpH family outer membrane protein [Rickettsiales bacterium]
MPFKILLYILLELTLISNLHAKDTEVKPLVYIDVEYIVGKSKASQQVKDRIKVEVDKFQASMQEKQSIISKQEESLKSRGQVLSPEVLQQEQEKIVAQFKVFEAELTEKKKNLDKTYSDFLAEIQSHIQKVVIELAEQNNYKAVVTRSSLVYAAQSLNISDDVVILLNKRVPSILVKIEK